MSSRNGGYAGNKLRTSLTKLGKWTIEIIKRSDRAKGFEILPRRWVVERTLAWLGHNRRVAKQIERTIESATRGFISPRSSLPPAESQAHEIDATEYETDSQVGCT